MNPLLHFDPVDKVLHGALLAGQYIDLDGKPKQGEWLGRGESQRDGNPFAPGHVVSMIDVDRNPPMDMDTPMSDACPSCGGHHLRVGDWVCWGRCFECYDRDCAELWPALRAHHEAEQEAGR